MSCCSSEASGAIKPGYYDHVQVWINLSELTIEAMELGMDACRSGAFPHIVGVRIALFLIVRLLFLI